MNTLAAVIVTAAVADRLTGLPTTAQRVFNGRNTPLDEADLPAWRIRKGDEAIVTTGLQYPAIEEHELELHAEGVLRDLDTLETDMDTLVAEGLAGLFGTPPPYRLTCEGITRAPAQLGERAIGVITLRLMARFMTRQNAPQTILEGA